MKIPYLIPLTLLLTTMAASNPVFAHGEDTPGPHGGIIRMPGAFHTEVIPEKNGFKILLVDLNFENPMTKDSGVKAKIKSGEKNTELKCEIKQDYFFCEAPKNLMETKGTLEILPTRHKAEGALVSYPLPLEIQNKAKR